MAKSLVEDPWIRCNSLNWEDDEAEVDLTLSRETEPILLPVCFHIGEVVSITESCPDSPGIECVVFLRGGRGMHVLLGVDELGKLVQRYAAELYALQYGARSIINRLPQQ